MTATATLGPLSQRPDLYSLFHKGLRAGMADALARVGRVDCADPAEVHDACDEVRALLALCRAHLDAESRFIHVAVAARRPGAFERIDEAHRDHLESMRSIHALVEALDHSGIAERPLEAARLYRRLAGFVAENLGHMHAEETYGNAVLWETFADAELAAMQRAIADARDAAERAALARWVMPNLAPAEQAGVIAAMRRGGREDAAAAMLENLRSRLAPRARARLERAMRQSA